MMQVMLWSFIHIEIRQTFYLAIIMPDDVAEEKVKALSALGADIQKVRPASIVDKKQVSFFFSIYGFTICSDLRSMLWVPRSFIPYGVILRRAKNLARQRAKEFGQEDKIDQGFELEQQSYSLTSPSGSVLVSAVPPHVGSKSVLIILGPAPLQGAGVISPINLR